MPTRNAYDPGTPCWIDLTTTDVDAAKAFYGGLFGWEAVDEVDEEGAWIYANFTRDGNRVAGVGSQPDEMAGMPAMWNSYIATDDVDATLERVESAGGAVMLPAMDVMEAGRMAVLSDPTGAVVSLWQAGEHTGAEVVNEPGTWSWNELVTRDVEASRAFGADAFGWEYDTMDMPMGPYHVVRGGETGLAGMMAMPDEFPDQVPNHWVVYFTVADAAQAIARATELGATVTFGPDETPVGVIAGLHDPQGGSFSIMQPADDTQGAAA